ncbi:hypothetical protein F6R98_15085 [Candidatus Methylospira mobilis]|uniref:Uncharacterized protein n=1 Tax=Candidatus Methylospira mobilis TaxID=1808979 RepID=A0A5Q0BPZ3_9GAMM|nr:hypothetical protein [Candidatus Methylospira mobilis]QFY43786.1 hypothetical protein F6R98_15085 [Candidatus Methylospira mobilis]WNV04776.1 hypothetical protein RP726_20675 [Candidatus Methylospira mobilis]
MHKSRLLPVYSPEFVELQNTFYKLERPYGFNEIYNFNQIYERVYTNLRNEEKKRAEMFVDELIDGLEAPSLACRIFGVV